MITIWLLCCKRFLINDLCWQMRVGGIRLCYAQAMDRTALAITLLVAFIAALLAFLRLYFSGQMDNWFN